MQVSPSSLTAGIWEGDLSQIVYRVDAIPLARVTKTEVITSVEPYASNLGKIIPDCKIVFAEKI